MIELKEYLDECNRKSLIDSEEQYINVEGSDSDWIDNAIQPYVREDVIGDLLDSK